MQRAVRKLRKSQALTRVAFVASCLRQWDPLGLAALAPEHEYDAYAPPIVTLVAEGATPLQLAQYLAELQTRSFGVSATPEANLILATRIVQDLGRYPR